MRLASDIPPLCGALERALSPECRIVRLDSVWRIAGRLLLADVVVVQNFRILMWACALRWLKRYRIVSVDLILRPPTSLWAQIKASVKRVALSNVDVFILYFKNTKDYEERYGIRKERVVYVPFKVNRWEEMRKANAHDGSYVLCAGRTRRDIGTFLTAMADTGLPGVLLQQEPQVVAGHGTEFWGEVLPKNVRRVVDYNNDDNSDFYLEVIGNARVVVIPRFRNESAATGISTYLTAMALNRCVIISAGPGAEDVLCGEAVIVPPEEPERLAGAINQVWHDDAYRRRVVSAGRSYAERLGGEERLIRDIAQVVVGLGEGSATL